MADEYGPNFAPPANKANANDLSPKVTISIGGTEIALCKSWTLDYDLLQLGDPFSVEIDNADGRNTGKVNPFDFVTVKMETGDTEAPTVQMYDGVVTEVTQNSTVQGGNTITITGADKGWFLANCAAPNWVSIPSASWQAIADKFVDSTWGIDATIEFSNASNLRVSKGRVTAERYYAKAAPSEIPPIWVEIGEKPADIFLRAARINHVMVGVSRYGRLQVFKPNYSQYPSYKVRYGADGDGVPMQSATLRRSGEGLYTKVKCYTSTINPALRTAQTSHDWHAGEWSGTYSAPNTIPGINRYEAFSDSEQFKRGMAGERAKWRWQRGQFDSWTYTVVVPGVGQNNSLYAPDTMIAVDDRVNKVQGNYYVQGVQFRRNLQQGTTTQLTIKLPNLLAA